MKSISYEAFSDVSDYIYLEHEIIDKTWVSRAHYHNSIEFSVCVFGTHRICVNGVMHEIGAGDIFCVNSLEVHYFDIREGNEIIAVLIDDKYLEDLKNVSGQVEITFPMLMQDKEKNKKAIEYLLDWSKNKSSCRKLQHQGYADLFLGELYDKYGLVKKIQSKTNSVMVDILQYIHQNIKKEITLESIANMAGYSKNHFAKLFHEMVGQNFKDYLNMRRAEISKELIENTEKTIVNIAFEVGFDSVATFYRAYEKRYGEAPRKREKQQKSALGGGGD